MTQIHRHIDLATGIETDVAFTEDEIKDAKKMAEASAIRLAAEAEAASAKAAAQAKLTALGLTTDDLKALGL